MKITYTQFVPDPALRGTTTNLPAHIAQVLIATGQASVVPWPERGKKGWHERMAEDEALRRPNPQDVNPSVVGTEWGIRDRDRSVFSKVLILKRVGAETFFFEAPPTDCPPSIVQQFRDLTKVEDGARATQLAEAKKAQQALKHDEKLGVLQDLYKNW